MYLIKSLEMSDLANKLPAKMSSRERDELLKRGIHITPQTEPIPAQLQQQVTPQLDQAPPQQPEQPTSKELSATHSPLKEQSSPTRDNDNNDNEIQSTPRGFVCEKCKWCDGFEPLEGDQQVCRVCKCDLIFHIDVIEEDDDDAEEFSSGEEGDVWTAGGMHAEGSSGED